MSARNVEGPLRGDTVTLAEGWRGEVDYRAAGWLIPMDPDDRTGPVLWLRRLEISADPRLGPNEDDDGLYLAPPETAGLRWDPSAECWRGEVEA